MDAYLEQALTSEAERASVARDLRIVASDGVSLAATLYTPSVPTGRARTVIINSAMAVPRRYYAPFARHLATHGLTVVTYDYRDMGDSRTGSPRASRAHLRDWGEKDFSAVLEWTEKTLGAPPAVIGHSVGGQIVGLAANNARVQRLLLVGAQSGDWRLWPPAARVGALVFWYGVMGPVTQALGYLPGGILGGEPVPGAVAREWSRWARRPGYMVGGKDGARAEGFARVRAPILAFSFDDDRFAPIPAVEGLLALYRSAERKHHHVKARDLRLPSVGHFGFFRPAVREALWGEALDWLRGATIDPRFS